ncbi:6-phosphogluconolactonase [Legionella fallonii]|uniref:6-phosphogluconolactonase n=1 Tax=Legionella fallonii LLAP-10 TaxID=1212491 RepID=A0A098G6I8_9GAMM|nr:6-phosphogluconolactonase [Legionella fallonii]CEG58062.1 6-phosphogluconolactonase [Legionella fallonii LLAP-10]
MQLHSFSDATLLHSDLVAQIKHVLEQAITQRGYAYLVVSGGRTPVELFKLLAQTQIQWEKVTITLTDERCVGMEDKDRNERLVRNYLLQHEAKRAKFISLFDEHINITESIQNASNIIAALPTFDVVILGMGEDGHTASLFPCSKELTYGLDDNAEAVFLVTPQTASHQRVSLSKNRLLDSRIIFLHLIGPKKRSIFNQALAEYDPLSMPIRAFLNNQSTNMHVMYAP